MAEIVLNVEVRERTGTGGARDTRRSGMVPGVLYGGDKDPVAIAVRANEFRKALYTGKLLGHLVTLKYGNETQPVIAKAVDMHPVTDEPQHFDLYRVDEHQQIKIEVPVHFTNQDDSPGLKRGGTLNVALHTLTVSCPADSIPEEIVFDLTGLEIGATIRVADLKLPAKAEAAVDGETVVASVAGAMAEVAEEAAEGAEGEAAAEGGEE
ncbi:ribosomal 5S rRNA E-loop binding protein Ctc/L25/TL5 [Phenylobacterium zucineum HLK1]|uniref:Large ribosomal subunit protein bL25 n=1 Tax=Phenylobacterium zucineum (strain HLK1) TaxID=450851 RepID=RL25_PHEZH|nr:50S ribosomal protein L25/general stress protein Ctc [Phenylobacterium zucineum]B4R8Q7.1 RecName: Full=Large ribosomal subunit protein bL25; AltName: Full=50S ribosomal protein L25; AltName: Full=General stress protein CTC [Phenylobacterium zucineum HLK1]ACG79272.1 ribosomal 5S rRNA E-loop binding protein Ctc/L25/TL5 [Phenylobacterium zucineum HLK1]